MGFFGSEIVMAELTDVLVPDFLESINVQLANEGGQVVVLEMLGYNFR